MAQHHCGENAIAVGETAKTSKGKLTAGERYSALSQSFFSRLLSHQALSLARTSFS